MTASYTSLRVGEIAPDFTLLSDAGTPLSLSSLRGQRVVLFFYAKDSSPGCSLEAKEFAAEVPRLRRANTIVIGIGPGTVRPKARFKAAQQLNFSLLADEHAVAAQAFGVWHEKVLFGHKYLGAMRTTFVIAADGRIERIWEHVEYRGHAAEVSAFVRGVAGPKPAPPAPPRAAKRAPPPTRRAAKKK